MEICAVCGNGIGSSLILKMNIEKVLKELDKSDVKVSHSDLSSLSGISPDLIIASKDIASACPSDIKTVPLTNVMDKVGLKKALEEFFSEME